MQSSKGKQNRGHAIFKVIIKILISWLFRILTLKEYSFKSEFVEGYSYEYNHYISEHMEQKEDSKNSQRNETGYTWRIWTIMTLDFCCKDGKQKTVN